MRLHTTMRKKIWCGKMHHIFFLIVVLCIITACESTPSDFHGQSHSPLLGTYSYTPSPRQTTRSRLLFSTMQFPDAANPVRAAVAARIQQNLRAIGIQVTVAYYPLNTFFGVYTRGGILAMGAYDLALFTYANK